MAEIFKVPQFYKVPYNIDAGITAVLQAVMKLNDAGDTLKAIVLSEYYGGGNADELLRKFHGIQIVVLPHLMMRDNSAWAAVGERMVVWSQGVD